MYLPNECRQDALHERRFVEAGAMPSTSCKKTHNLKHWHGRHLNCHLVVTKPASVCPDIRLLKADCSRSVFLGPITAAARTRHSSSSETTDRCTSTSGHSTAMSHMRGLSDCYPLSDRLFATRS
jgi:hypothetical protein